MNVRSFIVYASQKGRKDINITFFYSFVVWLLLRERNIWTCTTTTATTTTLSAFEKEKNTHHGKKPVLRPFQAWSRFERIEWEKQSSIHDHFTNTMNDESILFASCLFPSFCPFCRVCVCVSLPSPDSLTHSQPTLYSQQYFCWWHKKCMYEKSISCAE